MKQNLSRTLARLRTTFMSFTLGQRLVVAVGGAALLLAAFMVFRWVSTPNYAPLYSNLAASKGVSPSDVGVTAGCQLLARVTVGETYMLADGKWRRRGAGQAAPVPDYCR